VAEVAARRQHVDHRCTDSEFLPPAMLDRVAGDGGRGALQDRLTAIKQLVAAL
jgi:hypothetical protein